MKVKTYASSYIVIQAESIHEGVQLGILQEQLKAIGRDIRVMGDIIEIPLADPILPDTIKKRKTSKPT